MDLDHPQSRSPLTDAIGRTGWGESADRTRQGLTAAAVVALVSFVVALFAIEARATVGARLTADEPQYLLTAISLGEDLDLDVSDELLAERYLDFHELPLNQQTIELNDAGQRLSPHDPGLPALLAGPMRLGGWRLAKATLALLTAATAAATTLVAIGRFRVAPAVAGAVTLGLFVAPPLVGYATQIYPEIPAALTVVCGLSAVTALSRSTRGDLVAVVAVVVLPWLAVKYVPVAAVLAVGLLVQADGSGRARSRWSAARLVLVLAVMGIIYLLVHRRVYGGWTVYSAGDHFVDGEFQVVGSNPDYVGRSRRLVGLLVDREFGLAAWAPAYLLLVPALARVARSRPPGWAVVVSVVAVGWATATWVAFTMHGWWLPGRQLVSILPAAAVAIAVLVDRRPVLRSVFLVASALAAVNWLWLVVEASTGRRTLVVDFMDTSSPIYRLWSSVLPDHRVLGPVDVALTAVWLGVLAGLGLWGWRDTAQQ